MEKRQKIGVMLFVLVVGVIIGIISGYGLGYAFFQPQVTQLESVISQKDTQITQLESGLLEAQNNIWNNITYLFEQISAINSTQLSLRNQIEEAIAFNYTNSNVQDSTTETNWTNMPNMSLTITLNRSSTLLIMFSSESAIFDHTYTVMWRVIVNNKTALPGELYLQPPGEGISFSTISYTFYEPLVSAGQYVVNMQWKVTGSTGVVRDRTLFVIVLPS